MAYSRLRRSSDQRKALLRDLVTDLILNGKIEIERRLVFITKEGATPDKYPRKSGIPEKRPIGGKG